MNTTSNCVHVTDTRPVPTRSGRVWGRRSATAGFGHRLIGICLALGLLLVPWMASRPAAACEICGQPTLTLADRIARSEVVVLGKWVSAKSDKQAKPAASLFDVAEVRGEGASVAKGDRLSVRGYHAGTPGALRLLTGNLNDDQSIHWDEPLEMTEAGWRYATEAPDPQSPWSDRLAYYLKFLEHGDVILANDAHAEVVNAPTMEIANAARLIGPEKLRGWLSSPKTPAIRRSAYWVLLGYCGTEADERQLETLVRAEGKTLRLGLSGLIFGYLQLSGERGLQVVNERYFATATETDESGETGDAIKAVSWCWNNGNGKVSREDLRRALRPLYTHPLHGVTVLQTLARWKDWELQDELVSKYGTPGFNDSTMKKAIAKFLVSATLDQPADNPTNPPPHVIVARKHLQQLRQRDPKVVAAAERDLLVT